LYVLIFLLNIFHAFFTPAFKSAIPQVIANRENYSNAIILSNGTWQLLGMLGPGLAGGLAAFLGARQIFFFDAVTFVVAAFLILAIPGKLIAGKVPATTQLRVSVWKDITIGTRLLFKSRPLRFAVMIEMIIAIAGAQIFVNTVGLVKGGMGYNDQYYGYVMMAFGIGATLAAFFSNTIDRSKNKRFLLLLAATLIISAISFANFVPYPVLLFLWIFAGLGQGFTYLPSQIMVAETIPIHEQGRVYGAHFAWIHLFWGFGYILAGITGSYFNSREFLAGGAISLILFLIAVATSLGKSKSLLILFALGLVFSACDKNHAPVISGVVCTPETRSAGTLFTLRATASDEDFDILTYHWSAGGGVFTDSANQWQTKWKSPVDGNGKTYTPRITASDGKAETSFDYPIQLSEPVFGDVSGFAYFNNCTIPVAGALISLDDKTSLTDSTGYFELTDIPVGNCSIKATKADFSPAQISVTIMKSVNLKVRIPMISVLYTSKLSGIVKGQDSLPIGGATVTMLNPDKTESKLTAVTNAAGFYRIWYVPLGQRNIVARKAQTEEFGFAEVSLNLAINLPDYLLDIEMRKYNLMGTFSDNRDQHQYGYKIYGGQTWMTENLSYLPTVNPAKDASDNIAYYYVYGYEGKNVDEAKATSNFTSYGVLYNWAASQKACPLGWHLPSDVEWKILENYLGSDAGVRMKSASGWYNHGNGSNLSGFNAYPAGSRDDANGFNGLEHLTVFWSNTIVIGRGAWSRSFYNDDNVVHHFTNALKSGSSIRCMKD